MNKKLCFQGFIFALQFVDLSIFVVTFLKRLFVKDVYAVLLGGKIREDNLMEDHHLVFVVASNEKEARRLGKLKWPEAESIHVDGTQRIKQVDGYLINLEKGNSIEDLSNTDNNYSI